MTIFQQILQVYELNLITTVELLDIVNAGERRNKTKNISLDRYADVSDMRIIINYSCYWDETYLGREHYDSLDERLRETLSI